MSYIHPCTEIVCLPLKHGKMTAGSDLVWHSGTFEHDGYLLTWEPELRFSSSVTHHPTTTNPPTNASAPPGSWRAPGHCGRPRTWPYSRLHSWPGSTGGWGWSPGHGPAGHGRSLYSRSDWRGEREREKWLERGEMTGGMEGKTESREADKKELGWRIRMRGGSRGEKW